MINFVDMVYVYWHMAYLPLVRAPDAVKNLVSRSTSWSQLSFYNRQKRVRDTLRHWSSTTHHGRNTSGDLHKGQLCK